MKANLKNLIIAVAIPLGVGIISSLFTMGNMDIYSKINRPFLSPPSIAFPIVWTILFILMGLASYIVYESSASKEQKEKALMFYAIQLGVNFFWSIFFFNLNWYWFSFLWIVLLWILIFKTFTLFKEISEIAGYLLIPYLVWVLFAAYLNLTIAIIN